MEKLSFAKRFIILIFALFLFAIAVVLTIHSQLGAAPWDVFHLGLTNKTPLTLGQAAQLTGIAIILISIYIGEIPGIASVLNMYLIGLFIDLIRLYNLIPYGEQLWQQFFMLFLGLYLGGWASYFYLSVGMGAGPRDSLMLGLIKKHNKPVWLVRLIIEGTVLIIGYLLGGLVGVGTVIMAVFFGFSVQHTFKLLNKNPADIEHQNFLELYAIIKEYLAKKPHKETG